MTHRNLEVYNMTLDFVVNIYHISGELPDSERFGLTSQMRRSAVSIASNIAEGAARKTTKEFIASLYHALGSAAELETQIEISYRLGLLTEKDQISSQLTSIIKMLNALITSLKKKLNPKT